MTGGARLLVVCEGQTEAYFVQRCLAPELGRHRVWASPSLLKTKPGKQGGGSVTIQRLGRHVANEYPNCDYVTTLVDLYGLGQRQGRSRTELENAILEEALHLRPEIEPQRIIPYVQQYEFEALLFSDVERFEWVLEGWSTGSKTQLQAVINDHADPEQINDGPSTAPSKRLQTIFRGIYRKTEHGPIIAEEIGLDAIRSQCPRFNEWVSQLERLAGARDSTPWSSNT